MIQNPAFGPAQVRKFTSLFLEKSLEVSTLKEKLSSRFDAIILQLREIWTDLISKSTRKDGKLGFDAFTWLNKVTLEIIGLAGDRSPGSIPLRDILIGHSVPHRIQLQL